MPNKVADDKRRISFAAWRDDVAFIEEEADKRRCKPAEVLREALGVYVDKLKIEQEHGVRGHIHRLRDPSKDSSPDRRKRRSR